MRKQLSKQPEAAEMLAPFNQQYEEIQATHKVECCVNK